jgi:hypothetical protein
MATSAQIVAAEQRRQQIATRYVHGELQASIAQGLGVSQQRISQDLMVIRQHWLASSIRDFDILKAEQLAKVDAVEREAWAAWQRSQQPREVTVTEQTDGEKPSRKASMRREGQAGDPRFLERVQKCIDQRCEILGLHAAKKFVIDWDTLSDEQLERLARGESIPQVLAAPLPALPMAEA